MAFYKGNELARNDILKKDKNLPVRCDAWPVIIDSPEVLSDID